MANADNLRCCLTFGQDVNSPEAAPSFGITAPLASAPVPFSLDCTHKEKEGLHLVITQANHGRSNTMVGVVEQQLSLPENSGMDPSIGLLAVTGMDRLH